MSLYGAALQSLRYSPNAKGPEETKFGYVIYDGSPVDYHHWRYRTQLKVDASSKERLKETILNIVESLRGQALQQAEDIGNADLLKEDGSGVKKLLENMKNFVFPLQEQESKELYAAGHKVGGSLARQDGEPMTSYIQRRERWYKLLREMDSTVDMSDKRLGDMLLDNAGLNADQKLLILTINNNSTPFAGISDALIKQHAKIHLKGGSAHTGKNLTGQSYRRPDSGGYRKTKFFGNKHGHRRRTANMGVDGDDDYGSDEDWYGDKDEPSHDLDEESEERNEDPGDNTRGEDSLPETEWEIVDDPAEACELEAYAEFDESEVPDEEVADICQHQLVAMMGFKKHGKGKRKGKGSKGGATFKRTNLSLDERRRRLQELKKRTKCTACGQTGHWAGDKECPKNSKGSGKGSGKPTARLAVVVEHDSAERADCDAYGKNSYNVGSDSVAYMASTEWYSVSSETPEAPPDRIGGDQESTIERLLPLEVAGYRQRRIMPLAEVNRAETVLGYGPLKGMTYLQVVNHLSSESDPFEGTVIDWFRKTEKQKTKKNCVKYAQDFWNWFDSLFIDTENEPRCAGGCTYVSTTGSNAWERKLRCTQCGHRKSEVVQPDVNAEECRHTRLCNLTSTKMFINKFCLDCRTIISSMPRREHAEARRVAEQVERSDSSTRTIADRITADLSMSRTVSHAELIQINRIFSTQMQVLAADARGEHTPLPVTVGTVMELLTDSIEAVTLELAMDTEEVDVPNVANMAKVSREDNDVDNLLQHHLDRDGLVIDRATRDNGNGGPPIRKVDPLADDGVWATIDTACNHSCFGKKWRINAQRKWRTNDGLEAYQHTYARSGFDGIGETRNPGRGSWMLPFCLRYADDSLTDTSVWTEEAKYWGTSWDELKRRGSGQFRFLSVGTVSYTHLTLPTKA